MGRKGTIERLDPAAKGELEALVAEGRLSLEEMVAVMAERGCKLSRSAVGRFAQKRRFEREQSARETTEILLRLGGLEKHLERLEALLKAALARDGRP